MVTFEEVMKSLFYNKIAWYVDMFGKIKSNKTTLFADRNNCTSKAQIDKWLCVNDLLNVAKFFNQDWTPNWTNHEEKKYAIAATNIAELEFGVIEVANNVSGFSVFQSAHSAQQAIELLGVDKLNQIFLK